MRVCDSCKYVAGRDWRDIPRNGEIPEIKIRNGHCRALPPRALSITESAFPPVFLAWSCGMHAFGWAGFWRALGRAFKREKLL